MNSPTISYSARILLAGIRIATIIGLSFSTFGTWQVTTVLADKSNICAVPGKDGPATLSGVVNTYYPGTANASIGATTIPVGSPSGAAPTIQAGDLLLVIQMQGADIDSTNTGAYGDGAAGDPGSGLLATNFSAGLYEYVVATSSVVAGSVSISSGLVNNYFAQNFPVGAGNQGQRRFQVIRVPQYSSATITGTVTALTWNGSVGGIVALDVAGTLNFNGNTINVNGQGFRGGGGVLYGGGTGASTDYRTLSTNTTNASKGEGVAGTPRFVFNGSAVLDLGVEGYPNGSFGRGAPGNAGGGSTDGDPSNNAQNTGGGGGGNGGAGGKGGFAWQSVIDAGGFGGKAFPASASRLVMGGGGGAGTINDNNPLLSSGGAGGGIVMVRAGVVAGNGSINANGADGQDQILNDSGGGAGAGGSVLIVAQSVLPAGLNMTAEGGDGGDAWPGMGNLGAFPAERHGPGGGGGGGVIFKSAAGAVSVAQGQNGITTTDNDPYGAQPGLPGTSATISPANITTGISGAGCIPHPTIVKTTSTPLVSQTPTGVSGEYTILVSIPAGQGTALGFTISDSLPTGFTYDSTSAINLSGGSTRVTTVNPVSGTSTPAWGTFDIPGGGEVEITFSIHIASTVVPGVYQNPATATYTDPTRTVPTGTTNTQYNSASSTGEDIRVVAPSALTADLSILKDDGQVTFSGGATVTYTVTVTNLSGTGITGAVVSDALPANISTWAWACTTQGGGASGCDPAASGSANFTDTVDLPVGGTIVYTVTATVVATPTGNLVNTAVITMPPGYTDTNPLNNTSTDTDFLGPVADLSLVKTSSSSSPAVLSNITFTLTVTNIGPDPATDVVVTENLPSGFTYVSSIASQGSYDNTTGLWTGIGTLPTPPLAVNGTATLDITVTVNATGSYVNVAQISASLLIDPDSTPGNSIPTEDDQGTLTIVPAGVGGVGGGGGGGRGATPPSSASAVNSFLIPVTGFAPNTVTELNTVSRPVYSPTTLNIEIPVIKVNTTIVGVEFENGGWDVSWLQDQAGWLNGTAYPTWSGNSLLTGHVVNKDGKPGVFSKLKYLGVGEYIFIYNAGYRYTYKVVSNGFVQPDDVSVLKHEDKPYLTLITCDNYDVKTGTYLRRVAVRALLVDVSAVK